MDTSRSTSIVSHIIVLFTAFPVHESAHALAAHWLGDDTAKDAGRITLNPIKHLSLMGTLLMVFAGVGWANPVPVNPNNFKNPKNGMAITALAGPVSNLLMAFAAMIFFRFGYALYLRSPEASAAADVILNILLAMVYINIGLAVFNLLPIPPMDGSRIFNLFMSDEAYFKIMKYERYILIGTLIAVYSGLLDKPLSWLRGIAMDAMLFLTDWIDLIMGVPV